MSVDLHPLLRIGVGLSLTLAASLLVNAASAQPMTKHYYWGRSGKCLWAWFPNDQPCRGPGPGYYPADAKFCRHKPTCITPPHGISVFPGLGSGPRGHRERDNRGQNDRRQNFPVR
jgi:hypothetical protein